MARINLLTRHYKDNYGSVLQTYATCKILENLGHDVKLINLCEGAHDFKSIYTYMRFISMIKFSIFRKRQFSKRTIKVKHINEKYLPKCDYTVVGSDQVWNKQITRTNFFSYFLDFVPLGEKRISLASSFGKPVWDVTIEETKKITNELKLFSAISVRESTGVSICRDIFNIDATLLIDPTIALYDYSDIVKNVMMTDEIVCYSFKPKGYCADVISDLSKKENMCVRKLWTFFPKKGERSGYLWKQGPIEWMKYIANAGIVVSDSFHGIVFSILFKKQFIAICADQNKFTRIKELLELFDLQNKIALSFEDYTVNYNLIMSPIDYNKVDEIIKVKQAEFKQFLIHNLI